MSFLVIITLKDANSESTLQRIRQISEDWVYLALLGTIMSLLALFMDFITEYMTKCRKCIIDFVDLYTFSPTMGVR